jgi:metal-responsive CopG/Arc/MetJ family transcriptional regulator
MKEADVDGTVAAHSIISLRLPARLVDELDARAERELLTRTAWIRRTLHNLLQKSRRDEIGCAP